MKKIIMYATLDVEVPFIKQWAKDHQVEIKMVEERLTPETVGCNAMATFTTLRNILTWPQHWLTNMLSATKYSKSPTIGVIS